jgi:hypothetical protein
MSKKSLISLLYRIPSGWSRWLSGRAHFEPQNFPLCGCRPDKCCSRPDAHSREQMFAFGGSRPDPVRCPSGRGVYVQCVTKYQK